MADLAPAGLAAAGRVSGTGGQKEERRGKKE